MRDEREMQPKYVGKSRLRAWQSGAMMLGLGLFQLAMASQGEADTSASANRLVAALKTAQMNQELKTWGIKDLSEFKRASSREKDPSTGKLVTWKASFFPT